MFVHCLRAQKNKKFQWNGSNVKSAVHRVGSIIAAALRASLLYAVVLLLGIAATPNLAQAQFDPGAIERQQQLLERQQLDLLRQDQERAIRALPAPGGTDLRAVQPEVKAPADVSATCREIHEIRIVGQVRALSATLQPELQKKYANHCLGVVEIEAILAAITKDYIDQGYITTRAYLAAQDLKSGVLEVTVVEGTVERFELQQSGSTAKTVSMRGAFPVSPGELLNLRDLEQGIDQINSLGSNNATLDVQPGTQPGQSVVVVKNQASLPVHLFLSGDNLGQSSTGKTSASATLLLDGLLGWNELLSFTRRQTMPMDGAHNSVSSALRAVLPFGYNTFTYDVSESSYVNVLTLPSGNTLAATGETLSQSLGIDRVVYRDQASRATLSGRINTQRTKSWFGGEYLDVSSRTLSTLDLGADFFTQVGGGIANARLGYVRGLSILGALRDTPGLADDLPHAQFQKYTLDLGYNRNFEAGKQNLQWSTQFSGQYALDTLYGSQQVLIGGPSSVRGPLGNSLSGDSGFYVRNELSWFWRVPSHTTAALGGRAYVGYDFGHVSNRAPGVISGAMSGITLGTTVQWGALNLDVFAARTLHVPSPMKPEVVRVGVRMSYSL